MADNANKTEQATATKLKKARDKGQIARSKDLASAAVLILSSLYFYLFSTEVNHLILEYFSNQFTFDKTGLQGGFDQGIPLLGLSITIFKIFSPLLIILFIAVPLITFVVGGIHFNLKQIAPKISKINPLEGIKRIFSLTTIFELFKSIFKISLVFLCLYLTMKTEIINFISLSRSHISTASSVIFNNLTGYIIKLGLIVIFFSAIDAMYQRYSFAKKMRMSKQEQKDEHKEQEGRPEVKQRIKQVQTSLLKGGINKTVPTADLVLVNPTHYSVALKYDLSKADAPFVVAKGKDEIALYIREVAGKSQIPIVAIPPLARAVYNTTGINQMIPNQLFTAVAQTLNYIARLEKWKQGKGIEPTLPNDLNIPDEFTF